MKTVAIALVSTLFGIIVGFFAFLLFVVPLSDADEPSCSLEKAFREVEIGETTYCKDFKIYRRGDGSLIVYSIKKNNKKREEEKNHGRI